MFFDVEKEIDDKRYILLMFALQSSETEHAVRVAQFLIAASDTLGEEIGRDDLLSMYYLGLISLITQGEGYATGADDEVVSISHVGLAALISAAPRHLDRVIAN